IIADDVDIITCNQDDEKAIKLSIKKLHGKYLMQHVEKKDLKSILFPHGTQIKLLLKQGTDISSIEAGIKKWILFPDCEVSLIIDGEEPKRIGFNSPKEALDYYLTESGHGIIDSDFKVKEETINGVTLAYAIRYEQYFREWMFLERNQIRTREDIFDPIGTCIEGVRVEFDSPGFSGKNLISIANGKGKNAPKTNVSRSTIENTSEMQSLLINIYTLYSNHVKEEICNLNKNKGFSITWASYEANFLLKPIIRNIKGLKENVHPTDPKLLLEAIKDIPCILVEKDKIRSAYSPKQIHNEHEVWTIDCGLFSSAEEFIKEIPSSSSSLGNFLEVVDPNYNQSLKDIKMLLCGFSPNNLTHVSALMDKEIDYIKIYPKERRIDLRWASKSSEPIWINLDDMSYSGKLGLIDNLNLNWNELEENIHFRGLRKIKEIFYIQKGKIEIQG
ncbi:MAG: hypothetical protein Q8M92_04490, partial [Candidatus Subteraquimicrobiales bacterium]|nr:hypothetical protein [Candidatus Subteraquimicrobiales bacterium]